MNSEIITYPWEVHKRQRIAQQAAQVYRDFEAVACVFAWGGTALGDADPGSDVDVGIYLAAGIPAEAQRKKALAAFADNPDAISFGKFADLVGCESFSVEGIHVFVGWWSFEDDKRRIQAKLRTLPDRLDDAKAENELAEIQRLLVLWDPDGQIGELQALIAEWFKKPEKQKIILERLSRAEYALTHDLPRAVNKGDVVWAEDLRHHVLNEVIRALYYQNNRFVRRLKGVDLEIEVFPIKPRSFVQRIREAAMAAAKDTNQLLRELLEDVRNCQQSTPADRGQLGASQPSAPGG